MLDMEKRLAQSPCMEAPDSGWWIYRGERVLDIASSVTRRHERSQQPCRIVCEGRGPGPHNVAIRFEDGFVMVTRRRDKSLRKLFAREAQLELSL
jgi:hypothetical protein